MALFTCSSALQKRAMLALGAITLLGGSIVGVAPSASAEVPATVQGSCGQSFNPVINGGKAHWDLSCSGGRIYMNGWVEDTSADGRCAFVKANFNNGYSPTPAKACPKGTRTNFSWNGSGTIADGYLYVA